MKERLTLTAFVFILATGAAHAQIPVKGSLPDHPLSPWGWHVHFKNVTVSPRDAKTATIKFDVTWGGSFRSDASHDAAWVFFKARVEDGNAEPRPWQHVMLAADKVLNPEGYAGRVKGGAPLDFIVPAGPDGFTGMIVRHADHHSGMTMLATNVTAVWDLTKAQGIAKDTKVCVKAYGVKMIYISEGPLYLGSGGEETGSFYKYTDGTQDHEPYRVMSAGAIPTGMQAGKLWARASEPEDGGEIPASFPNGYGAFYCMRHLLTGAQYACFLSSLPPEEVEARSACLPGDWSRGKTVIGGGGIRRVGEAPNYSYRYGHGRLKYEGIFNLSWEDAAAWTAWAGLRPQSEFEYAKCLRGPRRPERNEAAGSFWGINYGGARYNGKPRERPISVAHAIGRAFKGTHGMGTTTWPDDWPKKDAVGVGFRGGDGDTGGLAGLFARPWWCTSCRIDMATWDPEHHPTYGFRGARTAPPETKRNSVRDEEESSALLAGLP